MKWNWILETKKRLEGEKYLEKPSNGGVLSAVLAYPETYFTGMSNLGFQSVWSFFSKELGISCERAFLPDRKYVDFFRRDRNLRSLETQKPLHEFDMICFSVSFEMNYPMIADMLSMTAVPLFSRDRRESDPLVIMGGAASYLNMEPVADFIDAAVTGRAEDVWPAAAEAIKAGGGRQAVLERLAGTDGVYVPSLMKASEIKRISGESRKFFSSSIVTKETEFASTVLIEIMRGCPFGCRFCTVSNCFGKCMFRPADEIIRIIEGCPPEIGKAGLIGGSINAHPEFGEILSYLRRKNMKVGFSSLRADRLTPETLDFIMHEGAKTITLAPETANEKIRFSLGKRITDEAFLEAVEMAFVAGIENLKLYFMTGLPEESVEDAAAIGGLLKKIRGLRNSQGVRISMSVSQFTPKPFTPLERARQDSFEEASEKMSAIRASLPSGVKFAGEKPGEAAVQGILARGGRELASIMAEYRELSYGKWKKTAGRLGIDLECILRGRDESEELCWR